MTALPEMTAPLPVCRTLADAAALERRASGSWVEDDGRFDHLTYQEGIGACLRWLMSPDCPDPLGLGE